jgi:hypothetical protein
MACMAWKPLSGMDLRGPLIEEGGLGWGIDHNQCTAHLEMACIPFRVCQGNSNSVHVIQTVEQG